MVSFEGIDQCGKSTQVERLAKRLEARKINFEVYREPGSTTISEQVRRILLSSENKLMEQRCELMLYSAARAQLAAEKIIPALEKGAFVILDRYYHSTTAYQGYGRGLPLDLIERINREVSQGFTPDVTFIIDIAPEAAIHRRDESGRDRLERSTLEFFRTVREGYLKMAETDSRLKVINGRKPPDEIENQVWDIITEKAVKFIK